MLPSAERVEILKWLLSVYTHTVVNVEAGKSHTYIYIHTQSTARSETLHLQRGSVSQQLHCQMQDCRRHQRSKQRPN